MQKRQRMIADQRFDLPQYDSMLDLIAAEFHTFNKSFFSAKNFIIQNWKVESAGGLVVRVNNTSDSLLINPENTGFEDFNVRHPGDPILTVTLQDNATNYVEVDITPRTTAQDSVAIWDTTANSGQGAEFIQNSDTVTCQDPTLVANTVSFSVGQPNRIPLAIVTTAGGNISGTITDQRKWFFTLYNDWAFGNPRTDTTIGGIHDNDQAIKTAIKELKGAGQGNYNLVHWYDAPGISTLNLLERLNYILADGGNISWNLPKPAIGSLIAIASDPNTGIKQGDHFTLSDGVTAIQFNFDANALNPTHPVTIPAQGTPSQVKTAIISAINAAAFGVTASSGTGNRIQLVNSVNGTAGAVAITQFFANSVSLSPFGMIGGFDTNALTWTAALRIIAPSRSFVYTIAAQTFNNIADGEVLYVTLPAEGITPVGPLTVNKSSASAYLIDMLNTRNYIIAYRSSSSIYFGNGWQSVKIDDGTTERLGDGIPNEWLIATGLTSDFDATPPYTSNFWVSPNASFTTAISQLDTVTEAVFNMVTGKVFDESLTSDGTATYGAGAILTLPAPFGVGIPKTYQTGYNQLEVFFDGKKARQGVGNDWVEQANVGAGIGNQIQLVYALPAGVLVTFRIQTGGGQTGTVSAAAADVFDEGSLVAAQVGHLNFRGPGVLATQTGPNAVDVMIRYPRELGKLVKNVTGATIAAGSALTWKPDGTVGLAEADVSSKAEFAGVNLQSILTGQYGLVIKMGSAPGVIASLGAAPGQPVYLSETPGVLTLTAPTVLTDTILQVGIAEPPDGVAQASAVDLWVDPEVIAQS